MNWPKPFTHTTPFTDWLNRLLERAKRAELKSGVGYRVNTTSNGTTLEIDQRPQAAPASPLLQQYVIKSLAQDYFGVVTWDGSTEGSETFYVAKPHELRGSLSSESIDSNTYSYSYTGGANYLKRTASVTISGVTTTEKQDIVPRYAVNSIIVAGEVVGTGVDDPDSNDITLIDLNISARAWCRAYVQ